MKVDISSRFVNNYKKWVQGVVRRSIAARFQWLEEHCEIFKGEFQICLSKHEKDWFLIRELSAESRRVGSSDGLMGYILNRTERNEGLL